MIITDKNEYAFQVYRERQFQFMGVAVFSASLCQPLYFAVRAVRSYKWPLILASFLGVGKIGARKFPRFTAILQ